MRGKRKWFSILFTGIVRIINNLGPVVTYFSNTQKWLRIPILGTERLLAIDCFTLRLWMHRKKIQNKIFKDI